MFKFEINLENLLYSKANQLGKIKLKQPHSFLRLVQTFVRFRCAPEIAFVDHHLNKRGLPCTLSLSLLPAWGELRFVVIRKRFELLRVCGCAVRRARVVTVVFTCASRRPVLPFEAVRAFE